MKVETLIYYLYKGIFVLIGILSLPLIYKMFEYSLRDNWFDAIVGSILILIIIGCLVALGYVVNKLIELINPNNKYK